MLGVLETHPRPGRAGVSRLVDAVAVADAALVVVLAGAQPDDVRVFRVDDDGAERDTSRRSRRSASRCCRGSRSSTGCRRSPRRTRRSSSSDRRRHQRCGRSSGSGLSSGTRDFRKVSGVRRSVPTLPKGRRRHRHDTHPRPNPSHRCAPGLRQVVGPAADPSNDSSAVDRHLRRRPRRHYIRNSLGYAGAHLPVAGASRRG